MDSLVRFLSLLNSRPPPPPSAIPSSRGGSLTISWWISPFSVHFLLCSSVQVASHPCPVLRQLIISFFLPPPVLCTISHLFHCLPLFSPFCFSFSLFCTPLRLCHLPLPSCICSFPELSAFLPYDLHVVFIFFFTISASTAL